jgi:hypothetical protein
VKRAALAGAPLVLVLVEIDDLARLRSSMHEIPSSFVHESPQAPSTLTVLARELPATVFSGESVG